MSNDTNSLDSRIRKAALNELKSKTDDLIRNLRRELLSGLFAAPKVDLLDADGKQLSLSGALDLIAASVVEAKSEKVQDEAVEAFMKKVDGLQGQLDDLQQSIG